MLRRRFFFFPGISSSVLYVVVRARTIWWFLAGNKRQQPRYRRGVYALIYKSVEKHGFYVCLGVRNCQGWEEI